MAVLNLNPGLTDNPDGSIPGTITEQTAVNSNDYGLRISEWNYSRGNQEVSFENPSINELIAPSLRTSTNPSSETLKIEGICLSATQWGLEPRPIIQYSLCDLGAPQLTVYLVFGTDATMGLLTYDICRFNFIIEFENERLRYDQIRSFRMFVVAGDPRTSRGTVTTVQSQTNNGQGGIGGLAI